MNSKFWTIAKEVYRKNVKSIPFLIMVLLPALLGLFIYIVANVVDDSDTDGTRIAVIANDTALETALSSVDSGEIRYEIMSATDAQNKLKAEAVDGILKLTNDSGKINGELQTTTSFSTSTIMTIQAKISSIQQSLYAHTLGLNTEQVSGLLLPATIHEVHVQFNADGDVTTTQDFSGIRQAVATILIVVIWFFVSIYGSIIAQEIASEKGTRIMEVILSSVKAEIHFYGKLVGIMLVILTNVVLYGLQGFIAFQIFRNNEMVESLLESFPLSDIFTGQFWLVIPVIVIGLLLFTFLSALSGSLISRVEDVPKAQMPVTMIGMVGYMLSVVFASQPENIIMRVASYIPFVSSFVLPAQIATGVATQSQTMISMGIMIVTMLVILFFSANLYKSNVLIYSSGGLLTTLKQSIQNLKIENQLKEKR